MNIGRMAVGVFLICLLAFSMLSIFTLIKEDQSTDSFYTNATTINRSVALTETMIGTGSSMITPLTLVVAILFFLAAILIFRTKW